MTAVDGTPTPNIIRVSNVLGSTLSGQTIDVAIIRSGEKLTIRLTMITRP